MAAGGCRQGERRRLGLAWAATVGYAALAVVSLLQTAAGLPPLDLVVAAGAQVELHNPDGVTATRTICNAR